MKKTAILLFSLLLASAISAQQFKLRLGEDSPLTKLQMAEMWINNMYVDSVDENKLVEDAIKGMLEKLDPHSAYSNPEEVKELNEPLQGNFEGIGIQFNMAEDTLMVIQTIIDGPSEKVGILPNDRIISVNDTAIAGVKMDRKDIVKRLRGPKGTKVKVGVIRRGIDDTLYFTITRDKIPVNTIVASYMIRPGVGYVRIDSFGATTLDEFHDALDKLKKEGKVKTIIIDLQDNGGGYLQTAVDLGSEFLGKGDLVVYTEGLRQARHDYTTSKKGKLNDLNVIVLVNEFSASASEITAGAIQDNDRGMIIGRRTYGKGLVQRPFMFPDKSMIRLTTAHYYTPSGRDIQKPYTKGDKSAYAKDLDERYKRGEFTNADSIHFNDSLKCYTLKKHRVVYGGGGIMPDVFVPLDTLKTPKLYRNISAKSLIINANMKYIDEHRKDITTEYADFNDFNARFEIPQSVIDNIYAEAEKQKIAPAANDEEKEKTTYYMKLVLKALIARDIWTNSEYFRIMNEDNDIVQAALKNLKP